jgi:hypothetical protein
MSDLQKKWAKAKMDNALHPMATPPVPEFNESQDDDSSSASSVSSTGTVIPSPGRALFARPQGYIYLLSLTSHSLPCALLLVLRIHYIQYLYLDV